MVLRRIESNMLFINGFLAGVILTMISFMDIFRDYPPMRLYILAVIFVTAVVMGIVFQFSYMELRATNGLRWTFEQAKGKIPERVFELNGGQMEPALQFLASMHHKIQRHAAILLFLNLLKILTTVLVSLASARWQSRMLLFTLVWTGMSHAWIYIISVRSLRNGQFARLEIFNLLELYRFSMRKKM